MRTLLLLLGALLAPALAQPDSTPPHVMFTPQGYHVGTTESFSFSSYSQDVFEVTAKVTYNQCTCSNGRRRCGDTGSVFDEAKGRARQGAAVVLDVQMPGLDELQNRDYYVGVSSHNGSVDYLSRRRISFSGDSFGFLLVKTDKPIYKPGQQVNFCVVYVDKSLKPFNSDSTVEVTIRDAKFKQILKWESLTIEAGEFTCLDFPLSEEPNFGTWRIQANLKIPEEEGGCRVFYSTPTSSCTFKVEEFVLPKFEVTVESPKQITRDDNFITGRVQAKYTFGENVQGRVKLNATVEGRGQSLLFYERTAELSNGQWTYRINSNFYRNRLLFLFDPFCVNARMKITAVVEEEGRGETQSDSVTAPFVDAPVSLSFADDNPDLFRPGLNYTVKAKATFADGTAAVGEPLRLTATINNGERTLFDAIVTSNAQDGTIALTIPVPIDANCLKLVLSPVQTSPGCDEQRVCFSPSAVYSPTRSFLQLEDVSTSSPLRVRSRANIQATSTVPFQHLHLLVISQGSIQEHIYQLHREGSTSALIPFRTTHAMVPKVKLLGVFARADGELVADLIEVPVECEFENDVSVSFNRTSASPGDPINIATTASPGSLVLVSAIDKSLTLLAEACRSLEDSNICKLLQSLTRGSLFGGRTCSLDSGETCCPSSCSEPTKYGVSSFFGAAGVSLQSNMFQPTPPSVPRPGPVYPYVYRGLYEFDGDAVGPPGAPGPAGPSTTPPPREDNTVTTEEDAVRTFFPETWIFAIQRTDRSGVASMDSTVPDTITSWVAEAFALSRETGLGISPKRELVVSKPFFVSLELPFSINFGETVTIIPLVFNFDSRRPTITATISVRVDDDLDIVNRSLPEGGSLTVQNGRSAPFTLKLRPRSIGQLAITIAATGDRGEQDVVRKLLFVKPGCERLEVTENVFAEDNGTQCFNFTPPSCVIPGSASATLTVTGDVMSPPNLDRLLVLPSGCGEQNLVKMATNWVVAEYLDATEQLSDFIAVKIKNNIQIGYQRQLTYLQTSGCFSIWSRGSCSLWLTAAVVNDFSGIVDFYRVQEPGTELIDKAVINGAVNYVINNQLKSGELPIVGRVHNFGLLDDEGSVAHTAFGLLALKQYVETFEEDTDTTSTVRRARDSITSAEQYLLDRYENESAFCNYGQALSTYAVLRCNEKPPETLTSMLDDLRSRIVNSRRYPGTCFLCNECPGDRPQEGEEGTDCVGRPRNEGSAACVETTGYALLALIEAEDTQYTVCLARWLVMIRNGNGGYWSSQDTVIALQALGRFTELTYTSEINMDVTFTIPGFTDPVTRTITTENRFERFDVEIPSVPSNDNCVTWSGNGTAIIQSTLEYHGCSCCVDTRAFSLELATVKGESPLGATVDLTIRIRYLKGKSSNMAIVDVEIPSGYLYNGWMFLDEISDNAEVERVDVRGSNAVFYFNDVPRNLHTTFVVRFVERMAVEDSQQLPVTIYDYYDPGQTVTQYYLPESSPPLPPVTRPPPTRPPPTNEPE